MNLELLNQIHQIHQDLADGKEVELLRLVENRKVNLDLLKDIHELYYHGYLHLPTYCRVFGYKEQGPIMSNFKRNKLETLDIKETLRLYRDCVHEKTRKTNLERYGHEFGFQSPVIKDKIRKTNLERYGHEFGFQSPVIKDKIRKTNLERYGHEFASQSPAIREKVNQTNIQRYGTPIPSKTPEIQEKMKQTNLERYGVEYVLQSPEIQDKRKKTNLNRYGVEYVLQSPEIQEKMKQTNLKRFGVENASQSPMIRNKRKQTNIERYGVEYASQSPEIQEKIRRTIYERFGYPYASQSPEIQEKIRRTNLERYGFEHANQNPEMRQKLSQRLKSEEVRNKRKQTRKSNDSRYAKLLDLVENDPPKTRPFVIENYPYNHATILRRYNLYEENLSLLEVAIREILEKHKIEYQFKFRPKFMDGKELDFFIPSKNLAIEVNGLYWHSYPKKDKHYHQDKHLRCRSEGIQLLSFTEDQILDRLEIIESMILHKLGKTPYRLYAKKCDIREISTKEAKDFLEKNHLHGFSNASVYLGLEYEGKLVHVMSFGNNRFKKSEHPELIRSASLRFHSVAGGFQRLLKYYKRSHGVDLVESYVDFNISNGQSYELASRDLENSSVRETVRDNLTEPDLWFVYRNKRYRRQMFMKHNLHKIFKDFPKRSEDGYENITVREFLKDRGVLEYYGAGNLKFLI